MTKTYRTLPAAGSGDLKTFQLAACCLRSGFGLFCSASFSLAMTASKSAVLSGLMKLSTRPASDAKTRVWGAVWACCAGCAGGGCCVGGVCVCDCAYAVDVANAPTTSPTTIQAGRPPAADVGVPNIAASFAKTDVTVAYLGLHENGHYLVSKKHSLAGQVEARTFSAETPCLYERFEARSVPRPDIDAVARTNRVKVYALRQPYAG